MSFKPYWNLCTLGLPEEDGVYDVKIRLKGSCLNPELQTRLEFKNGEWVDYTGILEKKYCHSLEAYECYRNHKKVLLII